jgi:hypothetical protein
LTQGAERFTANDIDLDVLPGLSDEDLKELGLFGRGARESSVVDLSVRLLNLHKDDNLVVIQGG